MCYNIFIKSCQECPCRHFSPTGMIVCALQDINFFIKSKDNYKFPKECPILNGFQINIVPTKYYKCVSNNLLYCS